MSPEQLEAAIRQVGAERYHDKHPFHRLLHGGKLTKGQVQAWALNRYCYQAGVPRKDAALMSRVHDRELRRAWVHRILDHDGSAGEEGGIERWLKLTDCLGLDREYVTSMRGALPATRFAVEAYVRFVVEQPLAVAVASSLTELFAPSIHRERIAGMLANYTFVNDEVMAYFKRRLTQAPRDATFALEFVKANADLVRRFMSATTKAVEAAEKDPKAAAQSILDANPKGGKIETLTKGFELTIPLYRTTETKNKRPFQVTDQNMTDTVNLMVEYGGLDAKAKDNPKAFYTNDYLPQGGS